MMNVSGVGVNSLLRPGLKSNVTNAVAYSSAATKTAVADSGKVASFANKAWSGIKDLGIAAWEKGIKPAAQWVWNKALKPAADFVWHKAIKPAGEAVWEKALKPAGKFVWNKALKPAGEAIVKAGKAVWEKALKPAGQAIADAAKKVVGKGGEAVGAVKNMPKGAKIGLVAAGVALVATGIGMLIKNHNDKKAEQAEAV